MPRKTLAQQRAEKAADAGTDTALSTEAEEITLPLATKAETADRRRSHYRSHH